MTHLKTYLLIFTTLVTQSLDAVVDKDALINAIQSRDKFSIMCILGEDSEDVEIFNQNCLEAREYLFHTAAGLEHRGTIIQEILRKLTYPVKMRCLLQRDEKGKTPLHHATQNDRVDSATALLENIAPNYHRFYIHEKDNDGGTPCNYAMAQPDSPLKRLFREYLAFEENPKEGNSPIQYRPQTEKDDQAGSPRISGYQAASPYPASPLKPSFTFAAPPIRRRSVVAPNV